MELVPNWAGGDSKGGARVAVTLVNPRRAFVERVRLYQMLPRSRPRPRHQDLGVVLEPSVRFVEGQVTGLDGPSGRATVEPAPGGHLRVEPFDTCLIATGSVTDLGAVAGAASHAAELGTAESAARARARLAALADGARVLVVGGGLTAIELAAEIAEARPGRRTVLATGGVIGPGLSCKGRAVVARHLAGQGVAVHEHTRVTEVDGRRRPGRGRGRDRRAPRRRAGGVGGRHEGVAPGARGGSVRRRRRTRLGRRELARLGAG